MGCSLTYAWFTRFCPRATGCGLAAGGVGGDQSQLQGGGGRPWGEGNPGRRDGGPMGEAVVTLPGPLPGAAPGLSSPGSGG